MKRLWHAFTFWITDSFASRGRSVRQSNSLARTIRDATSLRGDSGAARSASENVLEQAVKGHEQYYKSLHKGD